MGDEDTPTVAAGDLAAKRLVCIFFQTQTFRIARTRKTYSIEVFVRKLLEDGLHYICLCIFAGFGFTVFVRKLL